MIWICLNCSEELGEYNGYCLYCKVNNDILIYNPDKYFIRAVRIYHVCQIDGETLTPQEELFRELFNHEKNLVKDMDILTLRAHREELSKIAFEARARLTAVDDEDKNRKKKNGESKPSGFERSINTDETATNAINTIKERKARTSKNDKIKDGLQAMYEKQGMSREEAVKEAERLMQAGTILARLRNKTPNELAATEPPKPSENSKPIFNPFEKKEN